MSGDWKPGDVALVRADGREVVAMRGVGTWSYAYTGSGAGFTTNYDGNDSNPVVPLHPLVVIDPEHAEQVARLAALIWPKDSVQSRLSDALREYAKPPKPEEPTGLYGRVEDGKGWVWVRTALQASVWRPESVNSAGLRYLIPTDGPCSYAEIDAVRVLSEGVTP